MADLELIGRRLLDTRSPQEEGSTASLVECSANTLA